MSAMTTYEKKLAGIIGNSATCFYSLYLQILDAICGYALVHVRGAMLVLTPGTWMSAVAA